MARDAQSTERATYGADAYRKVVGDLPTQFPRTMGPNCAKYLQEVVDSGLTSDMMTRFETAFAAELGVKHCIAMPGCTPSLAALASALGDVRGMRPGDEIIVSPVTDYGTVQGIIAENYIPVFADTAPGTINLSAETVEPCITDRTRAVLVVHKTGIICDMDPINAVAKRHGLMVIEDACQAVFGEYKGRLAGTLADAAAFSFDAEKTMGSDMGGCVVTDDDELAAMIRLVGQSRGGEMIPGFGRAHTKFGYAYRMSLCTAAISLAQLEIARAQVAHRDRMVRLLTEKLAEIPGVTPLPIPDETTVYSCWMVGFAIDAGAFGCTTDEFADQCAEGGIPGAGTGRYYLMPDALTFLQEKATKGVYPYPQPPASRRYSYSGRECPNAHAYLERFVRWSTFCEKYQPEHCELAARIVCDVAEKNGASRIVP